MKKLNAMLLMALCAVFSFTSCSDDDNDTGFGITGVTVATSEGASYTGVINQSALTIQCTVPMTTQPSELEACSLTVIATMNTSGYRKRCRCYGRDIRPERSYRAHRFV